jgi:hypothetical protein
MGIPEAGYYMADPRYLADGTDTFSPCTPAEACAGGAFGPPEGADCLVADGCAACNAGYEGYRCASAAK